MKTRLQPSAHDAPPQPVDAARSVEQTLLTLEANLEEAISLGGAAATSHHALAPAASQRPVARLVIALILATGLLAAGYYLWTCFFRFSAHGFVVARSAELTAPWAGWIEEIHVRPGQAVEQGHLLATVANPELDAAIAELEDELRTTQAELAAEAARLESSFLAQQDQYLQLRSQYFDLQGKLGAEMARVKELTANRTRLEPLLESSIVSEQRIESLRSRHEGSQSRVASLKSALAALEIRLEQPPSLESKSVLLRPLQAKIEQLTAEIERLKLKQKRSALRAPFTGKVARVLGHKGEPCSVQRPVFELLDANSLEIVVQVEADRIERFPVGKEVTSLVGIHQVAFTCQVVAVGPRFEEQPLEPFETRAHPRRLVPVYLKLPRDLPAGLTLRDGETVRIPTAWGG